MHQIYPLEKFLKDVKRLFKPKDKYLMASERHNIPLEYYLKDVKRLFKPKDKYLMASERHINPLD
jgi:hypothetical protein